MNGEHRHGDGPTWQLFQLLGRDGQFDGIEDDGTSSARPREGVCDGHERNDAAEGGMWNDGQFLLEKEKLEEESVGKKAWGSKPREKTKVVSVLYGGLMPSTAHDEGNLPTRPHKA